MFKADGRLGDASFVRFGAEEQGGVEHDPDDDIEQRGRDDGPRELWPQVTRPSVTTGPVGAHRRSCCEDSLSSRRSLRLSFNLKLPAESALSSRGLDRRSSKQAARSYDTIRIVDESNIVAKASS